MNGKDQESKKAYKHRNRIKSSAPQATAKKVAKAPVKKAAAVAKKEVETVVAGLEQFFSASQVANLAEAGVKKVEDLAALTEKDLLAVKGIGPAALKKVKEAGLALKA